MESSPSPENAWQSLDPDLLAALTKLADGCDELRRWALSTGTKNSTHDPRNSTDATNKSISQIENIPKCSNPADTTQKDDHFVKDNKCDDASTGLSSPRCSTVAPDEEPRSIAHPISHQSDPRSSVDETNSEINPTNVVSHRPESLLMSLRQDEQATQQMKKAFFRGLKSWRRTEPNLEKLMTPNQDWAWAKHEINKAWPKDLTRWCGDPGEGHPMSCMMTFGLMALVDGRNPYGDLEISYPDKRFAIRDW